MGLKVIVDVDTGVDDATALMLLLSRSDVEVLAITCVTGNVDLEKVCVNTLRVRNLCKKTEVPVFKGADRPILDCGQDCSTFHGADGLGDFEWSETVDIKDIQSEHAVMAILRLVNQHPGEITLIALGPLTNVALALRLDPNLGNKLKEVFIMGGNIEGKGRMTTSAEHNFYCDSEAAFIALRELKNVFLLPYEVCLRAEIPMIFPVLFGITQWRNGKRHRKYPKIVFDQHRYYQPLYARGNITVSSEFNFHVDPEAAYVCLSSFSLPIHLVPWEVCIDTSNGILWKIYDEWIKNDTPKARFLEKITNNWCMKLKARGQPGFRSCDLFAVVTFLERSSILEQELVHATVELHGQLTRGQMVIDWNNRLKNEPTVVIIKKICTEKVAQVFSKVFQ